MKEVVNGGFGAELGRSSAGVVNMVTRSGSNAFRGSLSAFFEPESLQDQEPNTYFANNDVEERELLELNATLGGPIIEDQLGDYPTDEASAILKDETICIRCALCAERCPTGAITMEAFCSEEKLSCQVD